jgi:hypothetical protein
LSNEELSELLFNCKPGDISESEFSDGSDMNVDMSSGSEQGATSDNEDNANDNSDMQHDTSTRVGAERSHFSLTTLGNLV